MSEHEAPRRKPVDYDELFPGRFVKAGQLGGKPRTVEIMSVDTEPLPQDNGKDRVRGVLTIRSTETGNITEMVLNSTNGQCIRAMFTKKVQQWIGKRITIVSEPDKFGRETVDSVRIAGSPDIPHDIDVEIRLPRKKPKVRHLRKTAPNGRSSKPRASQPEPPPEAYDDTTGEVGPAELREQGQEG